MKIAVTYKDEEIFQHFGHTAQFKIYDIKDNQIVNTKIVETNGSGHGELSKILVENEVNALICGGIGSGARTILIENNIAIYPGVEGNADKSVEELLKGTLNFNPETKCNHHNHEHEHEHDCSTHNCSEDKGGCNGNK